MSLGDSAQLFGMGLQLQKSAGRSNCWTDAHVRYHLVYDSSKCQCVDQDLSHSNSGQAWLLMDVHPLECSGKEPVSSKTSLKALLSIHC